MSSMTLGPMLFASFLAVVVTMAVTASIGIRIGRHNVVDVSWGAGFVVIAAVAATVGTGDLWRRLLLLVLVGIWGVRLAWHMAVRSRGKGEDPRYEQLLGKAPGSRTLYAIRKIYVTQGISLWFVSLPIQVSAVSSGGFNLLVLLGVVLWLIGVTFEAVADRQMAEFKSDPGSYGHIMDQGLWAWTRHPNYFGDACVWWGIFLVAASVWPGVLTVFSPIAMTYFLVFATGARLLERHMANRPGYREYQERTSYFIPRPPK